jgi:small subunit ribosomal protein S16
VLTIRLARTGRKNLQYFRIIVQDHTWSPKSGKYIEILGQYNPADTENRLTLKNDRVEYYLKNGACPSDTAARLLKKHGIAANLIDKFILKYTKQKSKSAQAAEAAAAPATPAPVEKPAKTEEKPKEEPAKEEVKSE